jgi:hypothetical protein
VVQRIFWQHRHERFIADARNIWLRRTMATLLSRGELA